MSRSLRLQAPRVSVGGWIAAALLPLVAALLAAAPVAAEEMNLPCESFADSHDLGGDQILPLFCSGAEGEYAVDLDVPGEWIELETTFDFPFCFVDSIGGQRGDEQTSRLAISFRYGEDVQAGEELTTDVGVGLGCEWPYDWVQSHHSICLGSESESRTYRVRIELLSGGQTRLDALHLVDAALPVAESTWGRIKLLYNTP